MDSFTTSQEKKSLRKKRLSSNILLTLLGFPIAFAIFYFSPWVFRWLDPQATSYRVQQLQPVLVSVPMVIILNSVAHLMAGVNDQQFKEMSFGTWSRYGFLFSLYLVALVFTTALMMGSIPQ